MRKYFLFLLLFSTTPIFSQVESFMPVELIAEPGEQKTNNLSTGSSASLRVGTSSTFGSNASVSSSNGFVVNSESKLIPEKATFSSSFGSNSTNNGNISVDVSNVRAQGTGTKSSENLSINADNALSAEAEANVDGIFSELSLEIDTSNSETKVKIEDSEISSEILETANGSANQSMANSLNVDITNNNFTNAFSQSF